MLLMLHDAIHLAPHVFAITASSYPIVAMVVRLSPQRVQPQLGGAANKDVTLRQIDCRTYMCGSQSGHVGRVMADVKTYATFAARECWKLSRPAMCTRTSRFCIPVWGSVMGIGWVHWLVLW